MKKLTESADFDVMLIDHNLPDPGITYLLAQLRADVNVGQLPLFVTISYDKTGRVPMEREISMTRQVERYRNAWVLRLTLDPDALKKLLTDRVTAALGKLTADQRVVDAYLGVAELG